MLGSPLIPVDAPPVATATPVSVEGKASTNGQIEQPVQIAQPSEPGTQLPLAERERRTNNIAAWANYSGYKILCRKEKYHEKINNSLSLCILRYQTSSGCPCYDASPYVFIPKHTGLGLNPNLWAIFFCCLCQERKDLLPQAPEAEMER